MNIESDSEFVFFPNLVVNRLIYTNTFVWVSISKSNISSQTDEVYLERELCQLGRYVTDAISLRIL